MEKDFIMKVKKSKKEKIKLNKLGYPVNDPYGLIAAFVNVIPPMTVFGKK